MVLAASWASSNNKTRNGATWNVTGDAINTPRVIQVTHPGGYVETHNVTTNGSGNVSITVVPGEPGTISATMISAPSAATVIVAPNSTSVVT